jgi:DNA-binding response OmpR family regulator
MNCLLLSADLMISSQASGAARQAGVALSSVANPAAFLERAKAEQPRAVIIDLGLPGLDIADVVSQLRSGATSPLTIVSFGQHVYEAQLDAAKAAGCDMVLTRGQFHAQGGRLLASIAAS